jgi:hypothetical protein
MNIQDVAGDLIISIRVAVIKNNKEEIKTTQDRSG